MCCVVLCVLCGVCLFVMFVVMYDCVLVFMVNECFKFYGLFLMGDVMRVVLKYVVYVVFVMSECEVVD